MEIIVQRIFDDKKATVGHLYIDGRLFCVTLEDTFRHRKEDGITRIPAGRYEIKFRAGSPMANRYIEKYGTVGMPWLQNVPGFEWVYFHVGNYATNTEGCILVGSEIRQKVKEDGTLENIIVNSTATYQSFHSKISSTSEGLSVTILDN